MNLNLSLSPTGNAAVKQNVKPRTWRQVYVGNFLLRAHTCCKTGVPYSLKKAYLLLLLWQGSGADVITMSVMLLTIRQSKCLNLIAFGVLSVIDIT